MAAPVLAQPVPSNSGTAAPATQPVKLGELEVAKGLPFAFGFQENGLELLPQELGYNAEHGGLELDGLKIDASAQYLELVRDQASSSYLLKFSWSKNFVQNGEAKITTTDGEKVLYATAISPKQVSEYQSLANKDSREVLDANQGHFEIKITPEALEQWGVGQPIRFCIRNRDGDLITGLCSKYYRLERNSVGLVLSTYRNSIARRVFIDGQPAPTAGNISLSLDKKTYFTCEFANGSFFELDARAVPTEFDEVYQRKADEKLVLRGHGVAPIDPLLTNDSYGWQAIIDIKNPYVFMPAKNGVYIRQRMKFHVPPLNEETRPFLMANSPRSTYRDDVDLHGFLTGPLKAGSTENHATMTSVNRFDWNFKSSDRGQINKRKITFDRDDASKARYVANYSIFRGLPYEVSGTATLGFSDGSNLLVEGSLFAQAWFEDVFNSQSYSLGQQRWGISADYFGPLLNAANQYGHNVGFSTIDGALKYRLNQGVWNYDTGYGVQFAFQKILLNATTDSMIGVGGFYAEKMPKAVDDVLNVFSFLRYPKRLDFELNYFPMSVNSYVNQGLDLNFTVRTKMFLKPNFFLQCDLSYKRFYFTNNNDNIQVQNDLYVVGLGVGLDF